MNIYSRIFHDTREYQTCPLGEQFLVDTLRPSRGQAKDISLFLRCTSLWIQRLIHKSGIRLLLLEYPPFQAPSSDHLPLLVDLFPCSVTSLSLSLPILPGHDRACYDTGGFNDV